MAKSSESLNHRVKEEPTDDATLATSLIRPYAGATESTLAAGRSQESQTRTEGPNLWSLQFNPTSVAPMTASDRELFTFCKSPMRRPGKHPGFPTWLLRHGRRRSQGDHHC